MLCPIGQSNEKPPLQALAKWREYVTIIRFAMIKNSFHEYLFSKAFCAFVIILTNLKGKKKVTEVNIRHMAYTGVMAEAGFDLIEDTIKIMEEGNCDNVVRNQFYHYEKPYVFLRDVDVEPLLLESEEIFDN